MKKHEQFKLRRKALGLTLEDVSAALLVRPSTVSRWERGARRVSERDMRAWSGYLQQQEAGA